jgi:hypothetical protein
MTLIALSVGRVGIVVLRHMWTAPIGKRELYVLIPLVSCGHMSGL